MSLSTTPALKSMISAHLGVQQSQTYFSTLSDFFSGSISRGEFLDVMQKLFAVSSSLPSETPQSSSTDPVNVMSPPNTVAPTPLTSSPSKEGVNGIQSQLNPALIQANGVGGTNTPAAQPALNSQLVQLHNALIISLFDATTHHRRQNPFTALATPTPTPAPSFSNSALHPNGTEDAAGGVQERPKKRKRLLMPAQDEENGGEEISIREKQFKRWTLGLGKRERERIKEAGVNAMGDNEDAEDALAVRRKRGEDEIARERGVVLLTERGDPPGSRLAIQLSTLTRAPSNLQHIGDRANLICAQHDLKSAPARPVAALLVLALEAKLKQLISHAISLTSSSRTINSISSSSTDPLTGIGLGMSRGRTEILTLQTFSTLFTISPSAFPAGSAAAHKLLALGEDNGEGGIEEDVGKGILGEREVSDPRWQLVALLAERSSVREALKV